ncbi:MAG: MBOAT family O-acyltransferase [Acidobacteriota bacterium]
MPVDSPHFLLAFLPALLLLHSLTPARGRTLLLLGASLAFYALSGASSLVVFVASIAMNLLLGIGIGSASGQARRVLLTVGVAANLGLLAWSKYYLFALAQLPQAADPALAILRPLAPSGMPLGVSFFTFSAIAYLVDIARDKAAPETNPVRFGLFMAFFPKITAGPIARFQDMFPPGESAPGRPSLEDMRQGLARMAVGLAKKLLLAGSLGPLADAAFKLPAAELDMGTAWLGLICYSLQLYFDFSGYTDMAVGLGRMFGYHLPENFNYPYSSQSVREFWRRWHITLSSWFRDYLYIPLGGGRVAPWKVQRNLLIVFALCGLWHGASWSFVIWGLWHGVFLAMERTGLGRVLDALPRPARHAYALLAVGLGWVFFRAADLTSALAYMQALFSFNWNGFDYTWMVRVNRATLTMLVLALIGSVPAVPWLASRLDAASSVLRPVLARLLPPALLAAAILQMAAGTHTPFIYAQF